MDLKIAEWCQQAALDYPWLVALAKLLTGFGSLQTIAAVTGIGVFMLATMGKKQAALFWLISLGTVILIDVGLKEIVHRQRPGPSLKDASIVDSDYSFPSGHTLAVTLVGLNLMRALATLQSPKWEKILCGLMVFVLILGVGWSRFFLRAHWFSDVAAGWLIGAAWFTICAQFQAAFEPEAT